jgi:hypothetical protein
VRIDETLIKSGDLLLMRRPDGIDPLIMISTGSHIAHSAVCIWNEGELYVFEN